MARLEDLDGITENEYYCEYSIKNGKGKIRDEKDNIGSF